MALVPLIVAKNESETSEGVELNGPTEIIADDLSPGEVITIQRVKQGNAVYTNMIADGQAVVLTHDKPGIIIQKYSHVRAVKGETENPVGVSHAS